jgi:hypothetical protein
MRGEKAERVFSCSFLVVRSQELDRKEDPKQKEFLVV